MHYHWGQIAGKKGGRFAQRTLSKNSSVTMIRMTACRFT